MLSHHLNPFFTHTILYAIAPLLGSDVDDLEEIGDLEKYVAASQCVLIFLSKDCISLRFEPRSFVRVADSTRFPKPDANRLLQSQLSS